MRNHSFAFLCLLPSWNDKGRCSRELTLDTRSSLFIGVDGFKSARKGLFLYFVVTNAHRNIIRVGRDLTVTEVVSQKEGKFRGGEERKTPTTS